MEMGCLKRRPNWGAISALLLRLWTSWRRQNSQKEPFCGTHLRARRGEPEIVSLQPAAQLHSQHKSHKSSEVQGSRALSWALSVKMCCVCQKKKKKCCQNDYWHSARLVKADVSIAVRLLAADPNGKGLVQAPLLGYNAWLESQLMERFFLPPSPRWGEEMSQQWA